MDALLNLGNLDLKEGKTEDAKKHLFEALKLSKSPETDVTINIALGNLHQQMGEFEKAMENYKQKWNLFVQKHKLQKKAVTEFTKVFKNYNCATVILLMYRI